MKASLKLAAAALLGAGTLALTATSASAEIACNGDGQCWHVHRHYNYQPDFGVVVHPDNWKWGANDHYVWHEHPGRGYWRNGAWVRF
ncbi:MAG TPA: hypothetical protein VII49_03170 [Rhizomicrobium sp.]